jgi:hypothetical protein
MGKLTGMMPELPASKMDIRESAELMTNTMQAMAGASELPVTRIKVPSGGGKYFTVDDDLPPAAAIEGVIMAAQYMNVYWDKPMGEGDSAPTCSSDSESRALRLRVRSTLPSNAPKPLRAP